MRGSIGYVTIEKQLFDSFSAFFGVLGTLKGNKKA